MPDQKDAREIVAGEEHKKRKFDKRDFDAIAEWAVDEKNRRQENRKDRERRWDEIDRQLEMEPDTRHKKDKDGKAIAERAWMAEMELPLQAQTLEVLTADARRLMIPGTGRWFQAHAALTDEYLERVDFEAMVLGDENEVPSQLNQDNADKLVEGIINHWHRQYDFAGNVDQINTEAFKYGVGVARGRIVTKSAFIDDVRGVLRDDIAFPALFPRSIRNTYLDDRESSMMNEGLMLSPTQIHTERRRLADIMFAANRGSTDPKNPSGGWMPKNLKGVDEDDKNGVDVIEVEGDIIVPRSTVRSIVIRGAIVTVITGRIQEQAKAVLVRFRFRQTPYSSYLTFPYHSEHIDEPYATSPLMKGRVIQISATQALNRGLDAAALNNGPPIQYDSDDLTFAESGGPEIMPYAKWATLGKAEVVKIGEPTPMFTAFLSLVQLYHDMTGVNAPRLGQQTRSHTTAFAKNTEIQRSAARTVDYSNATGAGPLTQWLYMAFDMTKRAIGSKKVPFWIDAYGGWVEVGKSQLPDMAAFEWLGSAGPTDEQAEQQRKFNAAQLSLQIDQVAVSLGRQPRIDHGKLVEEILRDGGWTDTGAITRDEGVSGDAAPGPAVQGTPANDPESASAALQALAFGEPAGGP